MDAAMDFRSHYGKDRFNRKKVVSAAGGEAFALAWTCEWERGKPHNKVASVRVTGKKRKENKNKSNGHIRKTRNILETNAK
ncbi:unnamed protein product [Strongylus vulgaris]|uniref:Uncharacterized protein n=1 Tax=Strongylus vulgaris TaxID=40348 RepID=A0A3P7LNN3_STRVU|nr:unnamed protein product [Strongylus vulgaris]